MTRPLDVKRDLDEYQAHAGTMRRLVVPPHRYLMVDGHGDPNTAPRYQDALQTLYPAAYALKAVCREELGRDHVVPPLEGRWWAEDLAAFTTARDKDAWNWTLLLLVPDHAGEEHVEAALARARSRRTPAPLIEELRCEELDEGDCVQTLHVGLYDDEGTVLARLHEEVLPGLGLRPRGHHHEIYLGDPRRTAPERLRTILRQGVEPTS